MQLAIDALCFVILGQNDVQAAGLLDRWVKLDIGAAAGHVSRNCDAAGLSSAGDNLGLLAILARVQDDGL